MLLIKIVEKIDSQCISFSIINQSNDLSIRFRNKQTILIFLNKKIFLSIIKAIIISDACFYEN